MANFGAGDSVVFMSDFGVPVVHAGIAGRGIVDTNDADYNGLPVKLVDRITKITVPTATFPTITREAVITVNGVSMSVRETMRTMDGDYTEIWAVVT